MRDVTKACMRVAADTMSSDLRTRRSCHNRRNPAEQTLERCLSIVRSDNSVISSTLTSLVGTMVSSPSCNLGPRLLKVRQHRLNPVQRSSVLSAFSFSLLADIQWPTSVRHRSSCNWYTAAEHRLLNLDYV